MSPEQQAPNHGILTVLVKQTIFTHMEQKSAQLQQVELYDAKELYR